MATVQDKINEIENGTNYVSGSLMIRSMDSKGVVLKWLESLSGVAERKKCFIELNEDESNLPLENRMAVSEVDVEPPSG